jgi:hypothetical protein
MDPASWVRRGSWVAWVLAHVVLVALVCGWPQFSRLLAWQGHVLATIKHAWPQSWWLAQWGVASLILIVTPVYIWVVHKFDLKYNAEGIFHIMQGLERKVPPLRLRVTAASVNAGFAATLLVLTLRAWYYVPKSERDAFFLFVVPVTAVLFLVACVSSLIQIIMYDYLLSRKWDEFHSQILVDKIKSLRMLCWHSLLIPVILIFCLIHPLLALVLNLIYGILLHWYYFFPRNGCRQHGDNTPIVNLVRPL